MSFTENLKVEIETLLNAKGFKQLEKNLAKAKAEMQTVNKAFSQASGLRNFRENVQQEAGKVRQEAEQMSAVLREAGLEEAPEGLSANFLDPRQSASGNVFEQQIPDQEAINRIAEAKDRLDDARGGAGSMFGGQIRTTGAGVGSAERAGSPMAEVRQMETPEMTGTSRLRRGLFRVARAAGVSSERMNDVAVASRRASAGLSFLSRRARGTAASLATTSVSLQNLQMQLLGVQFSLLSLAFIFGGLMGSALGAVGVFKILGNTLKMFFLPTALEVLPLVLDLRDAILGIDKDTRKAIGRIFLIIAAIGAFGSILAFTASGVLGFVQGLGMLLSPLSKLVLMFSSASSITGALSNAWGMLVSAAGGVTAALGAILSFLGGLVAGFKIVDFIINKISAALGVFVTILTVVAAALLAFTGVISAPFVVTAAVVGAAIGAIIAVLWNFRDTVWNILTGIAGFFFDIFKAIFNFLVGNSIVPDMVKGIVKWLFKIPSMIAGLGSSIIDTIVNGIKSMAGAIWNAFKAVMPDFLVDAIEGAGQAVSGAVSAVGDFAGSAVNAAGNFVSGVGNTVGNLNPFGENNGGNTTKVQQNTVNAQVEVNDKEETPQETGRQFGQGLTDGLNSRQSDVASGN